MFCFLKVMLVNKLGFPKSLKTLFTRMALSGVIFPPHMRGTPKRTSPPGSREWGGNKLFPPQGLENGGEIVSKKSAPAAG